MAQDKNDLYGVSDLRIMAGTKYSDVWEDFPYIFQPDRILNLEELNAIMYVMFAQKVYDEQFYDRLPEELKEFFVKREEEKK